MSAAGRPGGATTAGRTAGNFTSHEAAADGNWHSFAPTHAAASTSSFSHTNIVAAGTAWRGGNWVGGWRGGAWGGGWRGGWGWGWGRPGWNWGWGWGCCGWGWGGGWGWGLGWGWGWGGWGVAWSPFWAWPPYYYDPWLYSYDPAPAVLYPYPG